MKPLVPQTLRGRLRQELCGAPLSPFALVSYAQEGEDMVLRRYFENKTTGFYVDVGAHHPKRFSNTFFFYELGWRGINIDAMPGSMEIFQRERPEDINLEAAISDVQTELTYHMMSHPALNSFSDETFADYNKLPDYHLVGTKQIMTRTLTEVLDEYLPANTAIDFMSVDVEGLDFQVLKSNDWQKYHPSMVLVEQVDFDITANRQLPPLESYLQDQGYRLVSKTMNTLFFKKDDGA